MKYMIFNPLAGPPWEYPAIKKEKLLIDLSNLKFISNFSIELKHDEDKYSKKVSANIGIEIKSNPEIENSYIVKVFNLDVEDVIWKPVFEIHPKIMKVIRQSDEVIEIIGFGFDEFGNDYSDFGTTLLLKNKNIQIIVLHLFGKDLDIEYYPSKDNPKDGDFYYNLANTYLIKNDLKNAVLNMNKAAFLGNTNAELWLFDKGGREESETYF